MLIQFVGCYTMQIDMGNVANILEVHATSIFRFEVCRVGEFLYVHRLMLGGGGEWGLVSHRGSRIVLCTSEMLATSTTCTFHNHPRTKLTAVVNHRESPKGQ
jgi:hypothetical protein